MQLKAILAPTFTAAMLLAFGGNLSAQVAPAAKVGGLPISISVGISDYNLDYGPGRRMQGAVIRAGWTLFHGIGIDGNARTLFINTPPGFSRMQQSTFLGGVYYQTPSLWRIHPFVRMGAGLGLIEFPSRNPFYTRDTYTVYAPSGGLEYPITHKLFARAEYEYQFWHQYQGPHDLTPQGGTIGVTYYLSGRHVRPHPSY
jgi:opacity protein-like surface antigen